MTFEEEWAQLRRESNRAGSVVFFAYAGIFLSLILCWFVVTRLDEELNYEKVLVLLAIVELTVVIFLRKVIKLSRIKLRLMNKQFDELRSKAKPFDYQLMAECLEKDIARHKAGKFQEIGKDMPLVDGQIRSNRPYVAMCFWECWCDDAGHGFVVHYDPIQKDDWPKHAEYVIACLKEGRDCEDLSVRGSVT